MKKNIALIILTLALAVVTIICINARYRINVIEKQFDKNYSGDKSRIIILNDGGDNKWYGLYSSDGKLSINFAYDEQGLIESFGVVDDLSKKRFGFNFALDGENELTSFFYEDDQYRIATNIFIPEYHQKLIERDEYFNGLGRYYTLFSDGTTEIKRFSWDEKGSLIIE
jgi:hypothetical protein